LSGPPDAVKRFRSARDPDLFRQIVEEHQGRVFRLVASILGPWADLDAEEVTQDVFLRVYRRIGQFRGESSFGSWLYRIAYNTALNHRRTARIRLPHDPEERLAELPSGSDPLEDAMRSADRASVAYHLESLPAPYRTVVYLHYWKNAPVAEISELIGAPEGTVKSYLFRARRRLRKKIEEATDE
jgi:RNA polymerase sigma-70 factor (ECF subfamily)